ncbi:hypothetical protein [Avibacterium avium]|uniref:hypothetical protein n=1 Tax=Avibacterium avium TaxID=751 RepID=UPI003BF8D462
MIRPAPTLIIWRYKGRVLLLLPTPRPTDTTLLYCPDSSAVTTPAKSCSPTPLVIPNACSRFCALAVPPKLFLIVSLTRPVPPAERGALGVYPATEPAPNATALLDHACAPVPMAIAFFTG